MILHLKSNYKPNNTGTLIYFICSEKKTHKDLSICIHTICIYLYLYHLSLYLSLSFSLSVSFSEIYIYTYIYITHNISLCIISLIYIHMYNISNIYIFMQLPSTFQQSLLMNRHNYSKLYIEREKKQSMALKKKNQVKWMNLSDWQLIINYITKTPRCWWEDRCIDQQDQRVNVEIRVHTKSLW